MRWVILFETQKRINMVEYLQNVALIPVGGRHSPHDVLLSAQHKLGVIRHVQNKLDKALFAAYLWFNLIKYIKFNYEIYNY